VKALGIVKAALSVAAKKAVVSYYDLLDQYRAETYGTWLPPFFVHAQNALHLIDSRYSEEDPAVRCGIFFWACNTLKVSPENVLVFAQVSSDLACRSNFLAPRPSPRTMSFP